MVTTFLTTSLFAQETWSSWYGRSSEYIAATNKAVGEIRGIFSEFSTAIEKADNIVENSIADNIRSQAIIDAKNKSLVLEEDLTMLIPSPELKNYQQGLIDACDALQDFLAKASSGEAGLTIPSECIIALKEPLKEIARIYVKRGAPKELVESQNKLIEEVAETSGR